MKNISFNVVIVGAVLLFWASVAMPAVATVQTYSSYYPYYPYTAPAVPVSVVSSVYYRDLGIGSSGTDVTSLQTFLESRGYLVMPYGVSKGYFGSLTQNALMRYQSAVNIYPATGYFDSITRARVISDSSSYNYSYPYNYNYNYNYNYSTTPYVRVISPNGGELFRVGDSVDIRWEGSGNSSQVYSVCLVLYDNQCYKNLGNTVADSSYVSTTANQYHKQWYVDSSVPAGSYRIMVMAFDNSTCYANSYNYNYNYNYSYNNYPYTNYCGNYYNYNSGTTDTSDGWFTLTSSTGGYDLRITPDTLSNGYVNSYYSQTLYFNGFSNYNSGYNYYNTISWRITSGSLPPGYNLQTNNSSYNGSSQATISGTTQSSGTYSFTVEASDGYRTTSRSYTIVIN